MLARRSIKWDVFYIARTPRAAYRIPHTARRTSLRFLYPRLIKTVRDEWEI
jgi:hypothetical protein